MHTHMSSRAPLACVALEDTPTRFELFGEGQPLTASQGKLDFMLQHHEALPEVAAH